MIEHSIKVLELDIQYAECLLSALKIMTTDKKSLEPALAKAKDLLSEDIIKLKADYDNYLSEHNVSYISHHAEMVIDYAELVVDDITNYFDTYHQSRKTKKTPKSASFSLGKRTITVRLTKP